MKHFLGLALLVLLAAVVPVVTAQDGDDPGIQLACITGFGCAYTPLTDEDLAIVFPDSVIITPENLVDSPPADGAYNFTYPGATLVCNGADFSTQPEDSAGSFEALDENGDQILAAGLSSDSVVMDRYGPGFYAGTLTLSEGGGTANYSLFVMVKSENSVTGLVMGELTSPDGVCKLWVYYLGEQ